MDIKGAQTMEREGDQEDREAGCHLDPGPLYLTAAESKADITGAQTMEMGRDKEVR